MSAQTTHRMLLRHHPRYGHLWVPNQRVRVPHERGGYLAVTNQAGFRSDREFTPGPSDKPRILVFGDSLTAGDGCANHERFTDLLARRLDAEVRNYGLSGSGTDQQLLLLEDLATDVEADLVVLCVYVENIQRIMLPARPTLERDTGRMVLAPKPWFVLDDQDGLVLRGVPVPTKRPDAPEAPGQGGPAALRAARTLAAALRAVPGLQNLLRPLFSTRTSDYSALRGFLSRLMGNQPTPEYGSEDGRARNLLAAIIRRFHVSCAGRPLLVVPIPTADHVLGKARDNFSPFFQSLADPEAGLHVADLAGYLRDLPLAVRKRLTFDVDAHFSPLGHEQVARFLVQAAVPLGLRAAPEPLPGPAPTPGRFVLGLSCFYHNSAACLLRDGEIVAAAEEERFSRIKHDRRFPTAAVNYCLEEASIGPEDLEAAVFYDDPGLTFERLTAAMVHACRHDPEGAREQWSRMMPSWAAFKLRIPSLVRSALGADVPLLKTLHHRSHAASAFFPSPFDSAAILTIDGVGEWTTASIGRGSGGRIDILKEMRFPHSLGLLYSAFTQFLGFKVNSGEYKMMGLAPYGEPRFVDAILEHVVHLHEDGTVRLNMDYFDFLSRPSMTGQGFSDLFGPPRTPESPLTRRDLDLARSVQAVTEEAVLRMARHAHELTGERFLCLSGGVALNCVANGRILREGPFEDIWIQPAAGDAGGALGAALDAWHAHLGMPRRRDPDRRDGQRASLLGPAYSADEVQAFAESRGLPHKRLAPEERGPAVADLVAAGKVVGHFAGRLEYGPRALGSRSILGDPRNTEMQSTLNLKIKYRESFRPFAPLVLEEKADQYFDLDRPSPYMLIVAPVRESRRLPFAVDASRDVHEMVREARSDIPAVTHVDYSARIQTVGRDANPAVRRVLEAFETATGCAVLVNTSFNVRGEPIVNTPLEAYRCFMNTEMDALVLEDLLLLKEEQPALAHREQCPGPQRTVFRERYLRALDRLFQKEFLPLARTLSAPLDLAKEGPGWLDWPNPAEDHFPFPDELSGPDAARALVRSWGDRDMARALLPCLGKLLRLSRRHARGEALSEEVSDTVYVMF